MTTFKGPVACDSHPPSPVFWINFFVWYKLFNLWETSDWNCTVNNFEISIVEIWTSHHVYYCNQYINQIPEKNSTKMLWRLLLCQFQQN
jgi:hypothetical protein